VTNGYDAVLRRMQLAFFTNNPTPVFTSAYAYDTASRLTNVAVGANSAAYGYLANSPLVSQITFRQSSITRMTTTKSYDYLNRLLRTASGPSSGSTVSFDYTYNAANQRTRCFLADGSYWVYEYDALGQVICGKRYWADGTPVAGQQFEYGFDDIGNRKSTKQGGDADGTNLRSASYTNNLLDQITGRDVPGAVDILGAAQPQATVTVNGQTTYRRGEYYQKALSLDNSTAAVWQAVTNEAALSGTTNTVTGNVFLARTPESFSYDADGNLTQDGRWILSWDGENRLTNVISQSSVPTGSKRKLDLVYDHQGRRVQKIAFTNNGAAWVGQYTNRYVYDLSAGQAGGWNLVAILDAQSALLLSFTWGMDASGTMQGAGGVGGLVSMTVHTGAQSGTYFYGYDGNGNVATLVSASDGTITARYEYGPFGELLRVSGPMAFVNPFRFSTKYQDDETEFLYYGYRYLDSNTGQWLSRDPIGELGGRNLYAFVYNNPLKFIDTDGRVVIADDVVITGVIVAGGIAAWLATPQGQQWLQDTGRTMQEAFDYIVDLLRRAVRRCLPCSRRHPTWMRCPATATTSPGDATMRLAQAYPDFNGPHLVGCTFDGPATNCPGGAPGDRYYCRVAYWSQITGRVSMRTFSVNCCKCCHRFFEGKSCLALHLSGGGGQPPPTHSGD
jgi:RHS repeat-associated protein